MLQCVLGVSLRSHARETMNEWMSEDVTNAMHTNIHVWDRDKYTMRHHTRCWEEGRGRKTFMNPAAPLSNSVTKRDRIFWHGVSVGVFSPNINEFFIRRQGPPILSRALNKCMVSALMMMNAISATSSLCWPISSRTFPPLRFLWRGMNIKITIQRGYVDYLGPV